VLECVVNISEGRRPDVLDGLARATGAALLDVHADPDHHRSVFTIAGSDRNATEAAVRDLARAVAATLTLDEHDGVHPRLGAIDVVPFVALAATSPAVAIDAARDFAEWIARELAVPAFLYDQADPQARSLPSVRRDAFTRRAPDAGPAMPHPRLGAVAVGARPILVAVNVELEEDDLELARAVAHAIRERDGGLPGVRALGLSLPSAGRVQVSMNLVAPELTGLEAACTTARAEVEARGGHVCRVELVGLVPAGVLDACSPAFLAWSALSARDTLEARADGPSPGPVGGVGGAADATPGAGPGNRA
jgi:glutamate formiminotransferase